MVLAAGEGKRLRSRTPKVLHDLCGRPILGYVLDAAAPLKPQRTIVVVGHGGDEVRARVGTLTRLPLEFAVQTEPHGTADAVRAGDEALGRFSGDLVVLPGDGPLISAATLKTLLRQHRRSGAAATILTAVLGDPHGYGRIVRDATGAVARVVEERDATATERGIREVNSSTYVFDREALRAALTKVEPVNAQGEYYLTDVVGILKEKGERVAALAAAEPDEVLGINSRAQLAAVRKLLWRRTAERLMDAGVAIVDPEQTYIDPTVTVGRDTIVHPLTFLRGATRVGPGCTIGPSVEATDCRIDAGAIVKFSVLDGARVGEGAAVGPFAYLRPGAKLAPQAKVGTFVEVKNSDVGRASKVPHLSYVGDATIGRDVNVGAGSVTLNYDAETRAKSRTVIGDGAKIGGDTMMVAPVRIGKGAITGAGSVVTRDVPPGTVVYGAPARPRRKRKSSEGEKQ